MCAPRTLGFVPSGVFRLYRGDNRIQQYSTKNRCVSCLGSGFGEPQRIFFKRKIRTASFVVSRFPRGNFSSLGERGTFRTIVIQVRLPARIDCDWGFLLPASAESLIELNQSVEFISLGLRQSKFRRKGVRFVGQDFEIVRSTGFEA